MKTNKLKLMLFASTLFLLSGCGDLFGGGKSIVVTTCKGLSSPSGTISMDTMEQMFGKKQVDDWCDCAYDTVSKVYSGSQIVEAQSAGALDPVARDLPRRIISATAMCVRQSSVPHGGSELKDKFADLLDVMSGGTN